MPRTVDYPHAAFKSSVDLATAVDYLGGSCSLLNCAERLNKKVSGAFKSLVSAAVKHGLITVKKDVLNTTELYRLYKFSYNEEEKLDTLRKAFLFPALYQKIYERFKGKELPVSMLDKLVIRELGVEESYGSRVAGYFVDGVKNLKMLENGQLINNIKIEPNDGESDEVDEINSNIEVQEVVQSYKSPATVFNVQSIDSDNNFSVMIVGPGMNTKIEINEEDDLIILEAMINKIKRKFKEGKE